MPISSNAKHLVSSLLKLDSGTRFSIGNTNQEDIESHPFLYSQGSLPKSLPKSTLACPPSANYIRKYVRNYRQTLNFDSKTNSLYKDALEISQTPQINRNSKLDRKFTEKENPEQVSVDSAEYLAQVLNSPDEVYLVKSNDYSDKYGVGYSLSNGSKGMLFKDKSGIVQKYGSRELFYIERVSDGKDSKGVVVKKFEGKAYPEFLYKKCALFHYVTNEMENVDTPFEKRKVSRLGRVEVA